MLRCPETCSLLAVDVRKGSPGEADKLFLVSMDGNHRYPVINGIPRFVAQSNYADNFGKQWNRFRQTQLDSHTGHPITADRFWKATGWRPEDLKGKWVLDVGCGAGRFAEIALQAGARLVALDYSNAVDACWENLKGHENLHIVQGNIYAMPFAPGQFPYLYSLGVLQHTPDVKRAFMALPPLLAPGGRLCTDYYWKRLRTMLHAKYLFRPVTRRMSHGKLLGFLERHVGKMLKTSQLLGRIPLAGVALKRIIPVADYTGRYPLDNRQLLEWALLDTFDMLAPEYDNPQAAGTIERWFRESGLEEIEILHAGHLVGRGRKPG